MRPIYWYSKGPFFGFNSIRVPVKVPRTQPVRRWNKELSKNEWLRDDKGNYLYQESSEKDLIDVWEVPVINPMAIERSEYPTQKPEKLLECIIACSTKPNDIVLDCFLGSGTTAAVAQKLGRRWIGCDSNKGAVQTTSKRNWRAMVDCVMIDTPMTAMCLTSCFPMSRRRRPIMCRGGYELPTSDGDSTVAVKIIDMRIVPP